MKTTIYSKWGRTIATLALLSAKHVSNESCSYFYYQTKIPDAVKKLRRF